MTPFARQLPADLRALVALFALALLTTAGCGVVGQDVSLDGTDWRLTGWAISSLAPADFDITASFVDGQIGGRAAVNQYGGTYTTGPGEAFSTGELNSTLMAGEEPAMQAESAFFALLDEARAYRIEGDTLTLLGDGGSELLIFTRSP